MRASENNRDGSRGDGWAKCGVVNSSGERDSGVAARSNGCGELSRVEVCDRIVRRDGVVAGIAGKRREREWKWKWKKEGRRIWR